MQSKNFSAANINYSFHIDIQKITEHMHIRQSSRSHKLSITVTLMIIAFTAAYRLLPLTRVISSRL